MPKPAEPEDPEDVSNFAQQIAQIYRDFAAKQHRLDPEFENIIRSDLESLYER